MTGKTPEFDEMYNDDELPPGEEPTPRSELFCTLVINSLDGAYSSVSQSSVAKKRKASQITDTNVILREFLAQRPKPSNFLPQKPADDVQQFFDSMESTVRKFTPLSIAFFLQFFHLLLLF